MKPLDAKIISTFLIVFVIEVAILLPIKVSEAFAKRAEFGRHVLGCMYCFSGGMFFGTYLMFMAPEVRHLLESSIMKPNNIYYPIPELITGLGFFMCLYISKIVITIAVENAKRKFRKQQEEADAEQGHVNKGFESSGENIVKISSVSPETLNGDPALVLYKNTSEKNECKVDFVANGKPLQNDTNVSQSNEKNLSDLSPKTQTSPAKSEKSPKEQESEQPKDAEDKGHLEIVNAPGKTPEELEEEFQTRAAKSLVVFLALSIATVFDTMAVGLKTTTSSVWTMAISVMCLEVAIGFSLGLHLVANNSKVKSAIMGTIYALLNGLGCVIGIVIIETAGASRTLDAINGILQGIAAGTFIYTTFLEILRDNLDEKASWLKAIVVFIGFAIMCGFSSIASSEHAQHPPSNTTMYYY
jgi:zinc transporter ZupT